jgi:hypothetical protein
MMTGTGVYMPLTARIVPGKDKADQAAAASASDRRKASSKARGLQSHKKKQQLGIDYVEACMTDKALTSVLSTPCHTVNCPSTSGSSSSSSCDSSPSMASWQEREIGVYRGPMVPAGQGCYTGWTCMQRMCHGRLVMHQVYSPSYPMQC